MFIKGRYVSLTKLVSWSFSQVMIVLFVLGPWVYFAVYAYRWATSQ